MLNIEFLKSYALCDRLLFSLILSHPLCKRLLSHKTLKLLASNIFMLIYEIWASEEVLEIYVSFLSINEPNYFLCTYVFIDHKCCVQLLVNHMRHTILDVPRNWSWSNPSLSLGDTKYFGVIVGELIEGCFPLGYDKLKHYLNKWSKSTMIEFISPWQLHTPLIIIHNPGF